MRDFLPVYPYSAMDARERGELPRWRESHRENITCKDAIEAAIRRDFDGMHLDEDCVRGVIEQFGFIRVGWVLSNTIQYKEWDGRFSPANKEWAKQTCIPEAVATHGWDYNADFVVQSHPAILDGFVNLFRKAYQELGLFGVEHCEPDSESLDYEGKVLVLSPEVLRESCWSEKNQLWLAQGGFGCSPTALGRFIHCVCLGDGEKSGWNRADFTGVLKEEYLPDWAKEKLEQTRPKEDAAPQLQL